MNKSKIQVFISFVKLLILFTIFVSCASPVKRIDVKKKLNQLYVRQKIKQWEIINPHFDR